MSADEITQSDLDVTELRTDVKWIRRKIESHCDDMKEINERVSSLENWRSGIIASLALLALMVGWGWVRPGI